MLPGRRVPRRPREWGSRAIFVAVLFWIFGALLFATRLSILKQKPLNSASAPKVAVDAPSVTESYRRRLDTTRYKENKTMISPPLALLPTPPANTVYIDQRVSSFGAPLSPDSLKGGWMFTQEVYNHATQNLQRNNATVISLEKPRVVLFRNFLAPSEIDHLIKLAESGFKRSEVVSDSQIVSQSRTSYGAWLNGGRRTNLVYQIQNRIAQVTGIPEAFGESLYVLRYEQGQKYEMHTDHCRHEVAAIKQSGVGAGSGEALPPGSKILGQGNEEMLPEACRSFLKRAGGPGCGLQGGGETCGDRLATFIMYLKTPEQGGETVFPRAVLKNENKMNKAAAAVGAAGGLNINNNSDAGAGRQTRLRSLIDGGGGGNNAVGGTLGGQAEHGLQSLQKERMETQSLDFKPVTAQISDTSNNGVVVDDDKKRNSINKSNEDGDGGNEDTNLPWYCKKESEDKVLKVLPQPGDALFFYNYVPGENSDDDLNFNSMAIPDPTSAHSGCPPTKGTKMIATRWIRSSLFG